MTTALSAAAPRMINAASQGSMTATLGRRARYLSTGRELRPVQTLASLTTMTIVLAYAVGNLK